MLKKVILAFLFIIPIQLHAMNRVRNHLKKISPYFLATNTVLAATNIYTMKKRPRTTKVSWSKKDDIATVYMCH